MTDSADGAPSNTLPSDSKEAGYSVIWQISTNNNKEQSSDPNHREVTLSHTG